MSTRITDSGMYGHLWGTDETRAIFGERARLQGWLDVIAALARAQAAEGIIPAEAARLIGEHARVDLVDLELAAEQTRTTSHSTLGVIRALQAALPAEAREHVYTGATVQDITDTWTAQAIRACGAIVWRDLRLIEGSLLSLAVAHRDTLMTGRTHGQAGSPVTFGWKAASWADEIRRHMDRLREGTPRWLVGQLGGGVGSLVFYGGQGLAVRARFCAELGLADPGISWLSARDRGAEFGQLLALICGTLARIGVEVYELQRPEIGELAEPASAGSVGSITMPHKRNPEASEHLDTLARLVRASAGVLVEGLAAQHERDGRGWKAEWVALPEACLLTATALRMAAALLDGLQVNAEAMRLNLDRAAGYQRSEQALGRLARQIGGRRAQTLLQQALADGRRSSVTAAEAMATAGLPGAGQASAPAGQVTGPLGPADAGECGPMVDLVVERAHAARAAQPAQWP
ncbi:MAG TPA: lyase family protein [Streptosporangiaceae bacterium]|jgi:adenylosuccinate lyase|nr:lyase family protein [Streptosporangiaceae bacterium]